MKKMCTKLNNQVVSSMFPQLQISAFISKQLQSHTKQALGLGSGAGVTVNVKMSRQNMLKHVETCT